MDFIKTMPILLKTLKFLNLKCFNCLKKNWICKAFRNPSKFPIQPNFFQILSISNKLLTHIAKYERNEEVI